WRTASRAGREQAARPKRSAPATSRSRAVSRESRCACSPGDLRELHWHAVAAEWASVLEGHVMTTVVSPDGTVEENEFGRLDCGWVDPAVGGTSLGAKTIRAADPHAVRPHHSTAGFGTGRDRRARHA